MSQLTVNGRVEFCPTVYWHAQGGSVAPPDELLGMARESYSPGVREMGCRLSLNEAFVPAGESFWERLRETTPGIVCRSFRQAGYDCGSGPTESFCGTLTARLKGRGMRWDKDNAEAIMALASLYYSNLRQNYWTQERAA